MYALQPVPVLRLLEAILWRRGEWDADIKKHMAPLGSEGERTVRLAGERCRQLRKERGLSREALADLSSGDDALSVATIKRAELGEAIYPASARCLARSLGVPLSQVLATTSDAPASAPPLRADEAIPSGQRSVAVLPFTVPDAELASARFADGLVADLTHRLAAFWFPVIARASSFSFRSSTVDARGIGDQLGADYLVDGSVRIEHSFVRIIARLTRAADGVQLWTQTYEAPHRDILKLQDQLARDIGSGIGATMFAIEGQRCRRMEPSTLDAWTLALRSAWHLHQATSEDCREARNCAARAIAQDPRMALPRYVLVVSHQHELLNQWSRDSAGTIQELVTASADFERACPTDPMMYVATSYACIARGSCAEAMQRLELALEYDPNSVRAHSLYGQTLAMSGRPDQALHELELARMLSPRDPAIWTVVLPTALSHFVAGRYAEGSIWAKRAVLERPQFPLAHCTLAACYAHLGDLAAASAALSRAYEQQSTLSQQQLMSVLLSTEASIAERFLEGLRRAGMRS